MKRVLLPVTLGLAVSLPGTVIAQSAPITGEIVSGDCSRNRAAYELTDFELPTAPAVGAPDGVTAATSFTTLPVSFDDLLAVDHAVIAGEVCGLIGGNLSSQGFLAITLEGDTGAHGIAFIIPDQSGQSTNISVFLSPALAGGATAATDPARGFTAAEVDYLGEVNEIQLDLSSSLVRFGQLMSSPAPDDGTWLQGVIDEVTLWNALLQDLEDLTPPASLADQHESMLDALYMYNDSGADFLDALQNGDSATLDSAIDKLASAGALLDTANADLEQFQSGRSR